MAGRRWTDRLRPPAARAFPVGLKQADHAIYMPYVRLGRGSGLQAVGARQTRTVSQRVRGISSFAGDQASSSRHFLKGPSALFMRITFTPLTAHILQLSIL